MRVCIRVAIIDYGMGNIKSVQNALEYLGAEAVIVSTPPKLVGEKIVVPGVGAFGDGMKKLAEFRPRLEEVLDSGIPLLGICLGMQALFEGSEESPGVGGLAFMRGVVERIPTRLKLPQIGWNLLRVKKKECPLFKGIEAGYVYFVHSYHASPTEDVIAATTNYGCEVTASVWKGNVFGVQFHPEKSGKLGLRILKNFLVLK